MSDEITLEKLNGRIEAMRATQIALLVALASESNLNLPGIARAARSWAQKSSAQGDTLAALNAELDILDALTSLPTR